MTAQTPRHSSATHLLEGSTDIGITQALRCHSNPQTTARYSQVATTAISRAPGPLDPLRLKVTPPVRTGTMRAAFEIADIFHHHGGAFRQSHAAHLGRTDRHFMAAI